MAELKPCPFCGGKAGAYADPYTTRDSNEHLWAFTVSCEVCAASTGVACTPEKSWEAWNRRAGDD